jgi:hypothetical protein
MKKIFAGIILSLATVAALAMPQPRDIEDALAARDYQSAKSMTQEVLRERPDSAKAHLFNAYVLLKADNNRDGAAAELKTARMLDKNHKVQDSALFGRTVAELERAPNPVQRLAPSQRRYEPVPVTYTEVKPAGGSGIMAVLKFLFWATILGLIIYFVYKLWQNTRPVVVPPTITYTNHGRTYDAPPHPVYTSAPMESRYDASPRPVVVQPSTVVVHSDNSAAAQMNGMVNGMMLNEMMHHSHHHDSYGRDRIIERDTYVERDVVQAVPAPAYQPSYQSDTTDYETKRSSYSSGSDNSWFDSPSSSSGSDWGSSSSSDSGGGSWD